MNDLFDYSTLPGEFRLEALGLCEPDTDVRNPVGRPRRLSFRERLEIGVRWREIERELARPGRSTEHPNLKPLLRQIARARKPASGQAWKIPHLSAKADALGRYHSRALLSPLESKPEIDRMVAKEMGISPRMVRSARSDKRVRELLEKPGKERREWEIEAAQQVELRRQALALVTPERFAKDDFFLRHGALAAKQERSGEDTYLLARRLRTYQRQRAELLPLEYRRRPYWLAWSVQWARMDNKILERFWINGQESVRLERHQTGRRIGKQESYGASSHPDGRVAAFEEE
jgi:hypothetical protein